MLLKRVIQATVVAAGFAVAPPSWADAPPVGVYGCFDTQLHFSPVTNRSDLVITPQPFVMFGIVDGSTYSDWDGHHGHYSYDGAGGILTMTDGSRQGWRYRRTGNWSFTLIDNQTGKTIYSCPLDQKKNPEHGPW
ncbi:MAG: hypothetical protein JO047_10550 [Alphaproteobacteria bacterium]|nr:hypothetical protein [Alphaproteobacteria bacterium]